LVPNPQHHKYVPPPVAVSVDEPPWQIEEGLADAVAITEFTVTVAQAEAVHPLISVTVTQYWVVTSGQTFMVWVV
jgi:hypothetical protein